MPAAVYRMLTLLCRLVVTLPVGTNLGMVHLLWMLVSGRLLEARGAVIPALSDCGLSERAVRRAWAALGQGDWTSAALLARWGDLVGAEGTWQPHTHGGSHPVGVDVTGFWRPRLQNCPTRHYNAEAGKALPAIPLGLIGRTGSVGGQRLALPLAMVRADTADPRPSTQERLLVRAAVAHCADDDALVLDAGFAIAVLQEEGATRSVVRVAKNSTFRRTSPPAYGGRGRKPTRGVLVRPLARTYKGRTLDATPPDRTQTWQDDGVEVCAEIWDDLLLSDAAPGSPSFAVVAVHDPRYREPLLLASPLPVTAQTLHALSRDRWPVEQLPLAAKQMLGAARAFVHAPETCQRLPELALLAGAILSSAAASSPAIPTGFWDRRPQPTPGRLRRALARCPFPQDFPLPARIRRKAAITAHLPTGFWGQRRRAAPVPEGPTAPPLPTPLPEAA
jgi:hypothetical protein